MGTETKLRSYTPVPYPIPDRNGQNVYPFSDQKAQKPYPLGRHMPIMVLEEEEPLLIYAAQGSPFRRKKLSVINGSPEQQSTKNHTKHMNITLIQVII